MIQLAPLAATTATAEAEADTDKGGKEKDLMTFRFVNAQTAAEAAAATTVFHYSLRLILARLPKVLLSAALT